MARIAGNPAEPSIYFLHDSQSVDRFGPLYSIDRQKLELKQLSHPLAVIGDVPIENFTKCVKAGTITSYMCDNELWDWVCKNRLLPADTSNVTPRILSTKSKLNYLAEVMEDLANYASSQKDDVILDAVKFTLYMWHANVPTIEARRNLRSYVEKVAKGN